MWKFLELLLQNGKNLLVFKMKTLCIYHHPCTDGFAAAWAVRHILGKENVEFHPAKYQTPPPDVTRRDVLIVDFSYKRPILLEMAARAKSIHIIDHHKTAQENLVDLPPNVKTTFDMTRSGCVLTWETLEPYGRKPPPLFLHLQDRDLWQFKLSGTREIQATLSSYPYDFHVWTRLMKVPLADLKADGTPILRNQQKQVEELIELWSYNEWLSGYLVPHLNCPIFYSPDAGHIMSQNYPFAVCYRNHRDYTEYSLYSSEHGLDVSLIAKEYGGGGHEHAAGFRLRNSQSPSNVKESRK